MQTKPPPPTDTPLSPKGTHKVFEGPDLKHGFRLGAWEVRPMTGEICGAGETLRVEPRVMEVLLVLARRSGKVVERDELLSRVWASRGPVSDEPLTRCIAVLRRALNDSRQTPTYIQTIPKRGYRLLASVTVAAVEPCGLLVPSGELGETPAIAGQSIPENSIAVLPFAGGGKADASDFGGHIAGEIRSRLMSPGKNVLVVARTWSDAVCGARDLRTIRAQLRVARLLEGRVQRRGNQVRIRVDLCDAQSGYLIWSESFEGMLTGASYFAIQDRIASAIVTKLRESLAPSPTSSATQTERAGSIERRRNEDRRKAPFRQILAATSAFPQDRLLRRAEHLDRPNRPNTRIES